jgi:predicted GIY-YIG superfamily endonuclease
MPNNSTFPQNLTITAQAQVALDEQDGAFVVYLAHFAVPIERKTGKVRHYIGLTKNVLNRFTAHANGTGNGLMRKAFQQGEVILVRIWKQDGVFEQKLKRRKSAKIFCPICNPNKRVKEVTTNEINY